MKIKNFLENIKQKIFGYEEENDMENSNFNEYSEQEDNIENEECINDYNVLIEKLNEIKLTKEETDCVQKIIQELNKNNEDDGKTYYNSIYENCKKNKYKRK